MAGKDYTKLKKNREQEIVRMIYPEANDRIKLGHERNPDFVLFDVSKNWEGASKEKGITRSECIPTYPDSEIQHLIQNIGLYSSYDLLS
jgi:hypothetical protein